MKKQLAQGFLQGQAVHEGEAIRIEASGWKTVEQQQYNGFTVDLLTESGDIALRWDANFGQKQVVRNSRLADHWSDGASDGGWPHTKPYHGFILEFMRTPVTWQVSVNSVRQPQFDFVHRSSMDVTRVKCSDNLINFQIILCAPLTVVHVTHATCNQSVEVSVPCSSRLSDVRRRLLSGVGATKFHDDLVFVEKAESSNGTDEVPEEFVQLIDEEPLGARRELLTLGGISSLKGLAELQFDTPYIATSELMRTGHARVFPQGHSVRTGESIRVNANGWDAANPATRFNSFFIDLMSADGDIVFHWGARFLDKCIVRNSQTKGAWHKEDIVLGWPHGFPNHRVEIDFTRTENRWMVSINGTRCPEFDFAHRSSRDVTRVRCRSLQDAQVVLIKAEPQWHKVTTSSAPYKLIKKPPRSSTGSDSSERSTTADEQEPQQFVQLRGQVDSLKVEPDAAPRAGAAARADNLEVDKQPRYEQHRRSNRARNSSPPDAEAAAGSLQIDEQQKCCPDAASSRRSECDTSEDFLGQQEHTAQQECHGDAGFVSPPVGTLAVAGLLGAVIGVEKRERMNAIIAAKQQEEAAIEQGEGMKTSSVENASGDVEAVDLDIAYRTFAERRAVFEALL